MGLYKRLEEKLTSGSSVRRQKERLGLAILALFAMVFCGIFLGLTSGGFWAYFSMALSAFGIYWYVRWRTHVKKAQTRNKNSMEEETDE